MGAGVGPDHDLLCVAGLLLVRSDRMALVDRLTGPVPSTRDVSRGTRDRPRSARDAGWSSWSYRSYLFFREG